MTTPLYWTQATAHLSQQCPTMAGIIARYEGEFMQARPDGFFTLLRAVVGQQISVKAADSVWAKLNKAVKPLTPENLLRKRDTTLRACGLSGQKVAYARNVSAFFVNSPHPIVASPHPDFLRFAIGANLENPPSPVNGRGDAAALSAYKLEHGDEAGSPLPFTGEVGFPNRASRDLGKPGEGKRLASYWNAFSDDDVIAQLTTIKGIGTWTAEMFLMFHLTRPDVLPVKDLGLQKAIDRHYPTKKPRKPADYVAIAEAWRPYRTVAAWYLWRALDPVPVAY